MPDTCTCTTAAYREHPGAAMKMDTTLDPGCPLHGDVCPNGCGAPLRPVTSHQGDVYFVDLVCDACGQTVDLDPEGGV